MRQRLFGALFCALLVACGPGSTHGELTADRLHELLGADDAPLVLDVRSAEEFQSGHVPGARNIPHDRIDEHLEELQAFRNRPIVTYCQSGRRAGQALSALSEAGFSDLHHLAGDMPGWRDAGFEAAELAAENAAEESVRRGINDRFLSDDLDVEQFVNIFEGESREIFRGSAEIVRAIGIDPGMAVADIGAGTGLFLPLFADRSGDRGRVYAVEVAPNFLEHLRERKTREELDTVTVVEGKERSVELPDGSVDLAFVCDTYHHFEYPKSSLTSLHRAIRPGGFLVVIDFERVAGVSSDWVMDHVRAGKDVFRAEIEAAGFEFVEEIEIEPLKENYALRFRRS